MSQHEEPQKIVITPEMVASPLTNRTVESLQNAKNVPLVREVGAAEKSNAGLLTVLALAAGGLLGGMFAWAIVQVTPEFDDSQTSNVVFSVTIGLSLAISMLLAEGLRNQVWSKFLNASVFSIPSAIGLALLFGFLASELYGSLVESTFKAIEDSGLSLYYDFDLFIEEFTKRNHLNRGVAWSILGMAAGASVGIPTKSLKRVGITALGGFIGGFIGGYAFDYFEGESTAQLVGLAFTGLGVGLTVSLLEQVVKAAWIDIVAGGMAGKQFILYQSEVTLGSSPTANITLIKDSAIEPIAAKISRVGSGSRIESLSPGRVIEVNGVSGQKFDLTEGSTIKIGDTVLRYRAKASVVNGNGITRG